MSSLPPRCASSPEEGSMLADERKRKRMLSNRESARRSRMRKQQHIDDLINQGAMLRKENSQMEVQLNLVTQQYLDVEKDNSILRAQVMELTERLKWLNSLLRTVEAFSGVPIDIPEIPDPLLKPWQPPLVAHPIIAATADMLQF
ncbi:bZIP transcription factor 53-like [Typha angustifolia]|uniref:bZIP transcription factor 53-like n=1 Tax=Typha angustifolia TaxID=59011 RepID=UPI003C2E98DB